MKKVIFLLVMLIILGNCDSKKNPGLKTINLNENWQFRKKGDQTWHNASVPGTVHTDLLKNGIIEDPYYRLNEHDLQWIDKTDWEYKTTFIADNKLMNNSVVALQFEGLDTYAEVYLNDTLVLSADNMFRSWEVSCKELLIKGENELRVLLKSPINIGLEKLNQNGFPLPASNDQSENGELGDKKVSIFTRKAGYHYGWDWGPRLVTSGIWRPVKLIAYNQARIENLHIIQNNLSDKIARLTADVEINSDSDNELLLVIETDDIVLAENTINVGKGKSNYKIDFDIEDPKLWWPNGLGKQPLYDIKVSVFNDKHS